MMDEETLRKEFDTFWNKFVYEKRDIGLSGYVYGLEMWLESARRADHKAREDCVEILNNLIIPATISEDGYGPHDRSVIEDAIDAINATIKE